MRYLRRAARWVTIPGLGASNLYLINDTFTTDRAAGTVNDTSAEPGPGKRLVVDTNNKLSLSGGSVVLATGGAATGNPRLWYEISMERTPGRLCVARGATTSSGGVEVGWDINTVGGNTESIRLFGTTLTLRVNAVTLTVGTIVAATDYDMIVIQRVSLGSLFFIKGGAFVNWTLIWVSTDPAFPPLIPTFCSASTTSVATISFFRVPVECWLPSPAASDGFSVWGTSDGAGHSEGVSGGLGTGGGGLSWTNQIGTFGATGGVAAASALSGGVAVATVDTGKADTIVTVKVTQSAGVAGALVAYVDASNLIRLVHNGTNAQLIKRVAGVDTSVISVAATYVAGAEIRASREGTAYRLYYNNAAVGSQQTISDAVFTGITQQGLYTTDVANTLDDFTIYARGTGGEHAALDNF